MTDQDSTVKSGIQTKPGIQGSDQLSLGEYCQRAYSDTHSILPVVLAWWLGLVSVLVMSFFKPLIDDRIFWLAFVSTLSLGGAFYGLIIFSARIAYCYRGSRIIHKGKTTWTSALACFLLTLSIPLGLGSTLEAVGPKKGVLVAALPVLQTEQDRRVNALMYWLSPKDSNASAQERAMLTQISRDIGPEPIPTEPDPTSKPVALSVESEKAKGPLPSTKTEKSLKPRKAIYLTFNEFADQIKEAQMGTPIIGNVDEFYEQYGDPIYVFKIGSEVHLCFQCKNGRAKFEVNSVYYNTGKLYLVSLVSRE